MILLRDRRRWLIPGLLFFVSTISYLDRQTLSVLAVTVQKDLGFSPVEYSYVVTSFLVAYGLGFLFSGRLIDRFGVRTTFAAALALWSAAAMLHSLAVGWISLLCFRFFLGVGESFSTPTAAKAVTEWMPRSERGLGTAVFSTGNFVGAMVAPPLVAWLTLHYHWPLSFLVTGALGFVLLGAWVWFYDSPERHRMLSASERAHILRERGSAPVSFGRVSTWSLLRHPASLGFFCTRFFTDAVSYFFVFWLPQYLQTSRGFTLAMIGLLAWIPYLGADVGTLGGGAWSDFLIRRGWSIRRARLRVMLMAACLTPLTLLAVRVEASWLAIALIAVIMAAQAGWNTNLFTLTQETAPPEHVASVVAVSILGGTVGGTLSTLVTGHVIKAFGYTPVFTAIGFVHFGAYFIVRTGLKRADRRSAQPERA